MRSWRQITFVNAEALTQQTALTNTVTKRFRTVDWCISLSTTRCEALNAL